MNIEEFVNYYLQNYRHEVLLNPYNGLIEFAKVFQEKLMEDAVDYEVGIHGEPIKITFDKYVQRARGIFPGDKVRVIICKKED